MALGLRGESRIIPCLRGLDLILSAKSLLPHEMICPQVLGTKTLHIWVGWNLSGLQQPRLSGKMLPTAWASVSSHIRM